MGPLTWLNPDVALFNITLEGGGGRGHKSSKKPDWILHPSPGIVGYTELTTWVIYWFK